MTEKSKVICAFVTVCLAWGCSYFAIRVGLNSMPPLLMGAIRYGIAGSLMWLWCDARGVGKPNRSEWATNIVLGILFVVIGNGTVLWAEKTVPSGITALLVAISPLGTLLFEWALGQRKAPNLLTWIGILFGIVGIGILVGVPSRGLSILPAAVILAGTIGWSLGSALSIRFQKMESPIRAIATQMLAGSFVLTGLGLRMGESHQFHPITISSILALAYLIFIASIAAYIAYGHLMHHVSPMAAGVCSYVNPVVAMILGWFAGEPIGARAIFALVIVLGAVTLLSNQELKRARVRTRERSVEPRILFPDAQESCSQPI